MKKGVASDGSSSRERRPPKPSLARYARELLPALQRMLLSASDARSMLKHPRLIPPTEPRTCDWASVPMSVDEIKAAAGTYTVNDVLMAALSLSIGRLAAERKSPFPDEPRAVMWVSLRPLAEAAYTAAERPIPFGAADMGSAFLALPTNVVDARAALDAVRQRVADLIVSPEPLVSNLILRVFGFLPPAVLRVVWRLAAFKVTLSASNMRLPAGEIKWGNRALHELAFMVPAQGSVATFVCLVTINNRLTVSMNCGKHILPQDAVTKFAHVHYLAALRDVMATAKAS